MPDTASTTKAIAFAQCAERSNGVKRSMRPPGRCGSPSGPRVQVEQRDRAHDDQQQRAAVGQDPVVAHLSPRFAGRGQPRAGVLHEGLDQRALLGARQAGVTLLVARVAHGAPERRVVARLRGVAHRVALVGLGNGRRHETGRRRVRRRARLLREGSRTGAEHHQRKDQWSHHGLHCGSWMQLAPLTARGRERIRSAPGRAMSSASPSWPCRRPSSRAP